MDSAMRGDIIMDIGGGETLKRVADEQATIDHLTQQRERDAAGAFPDAAFDHIADERWWERQDFAGEHELGVCGGARRDGADSAVEAKHQPRTRTRTNAIGAAIGTRDEIEQVRKAQGR